MGISNSKLGVNFGVHPSVLGYDSLMAKQQIGTAVFNLLSGNLLHRKIQKKSTHSHSGLLLLLRSNQNQKIHFTCNFLIMLFTQIFKPQNGLWRNMRKKKKGKIHKNAYFAALTEDLDYSVGILLNKLQELGIANNTYIIYCSDNGAVPTLPPRRKYKHSYNYPFEQRQMGRQKKAG